MRKTLFLINLVFFFLVAACKNDTTEEKFVEGYLKSHPTTYNLGNKWCKYKANKTKTAPSGYLQNYFVEFVGEVDFNENHFNGSSDYFELKEIIIETNPQNQRTTAVIYTYCDTKNIVRSVTTYHYDGTVSEHFYGKKIDEEGIKFNFENIVGLFDNIRYESFSNRFSVSEDNVLDVCIGKDDDLTYWRNTYHFDSDYILEKVYSSYTLEIKTNNKDKLYAINGVYLLELSSEFKKISFDEKNYENELQIDEIII